MIEVLVPMPAPPPKKPHKSYQGKARSTRSVTPHAIGIENKHLRAMDVAPKIKGHIEWIRASKSQGGFLKLSPAHSLQRRVFWEEQKGGPGLLGRTDVNVRG